ncbi:MAG TPA: hypothetical protein DGD08_09680 [Gemmatimonas aurantiaca]|uniref:NAD-dependent epimerase/dehydratase domain-containing protein n=2 Tax=Gemmatimonas aurantiaca TaxID=173480 RepID=C1A9I2_GEMAT|nr:NAD-dependent epimerase/dehydratase family protein [Gemmatimonas aurantiaca]BAH39159.1 hypothetical protein GAU_2117 [Gemmatimonas aurantiaca T-27]HCT57458.1 hypothetical protein [Gemmatimonas aurantiaca]
MRARIVLLGPGWLGAATARHLSARGHQVWTISRRGSTTPTTPTTSPAADSARSEPDVSPLAPIAIAADLLAPTAMEMLHHLLPETADHLVVCVAPAFARGEDAAVYPQLAASAALLATHLRVRSVVYVSSTGIYDRTDGSDVDESSTITPDSPRVRALHDAELAIRQASGPHCAVQILRATGLYGPGRDPASRFTAMASHIDAAADGAWCNFVWRDDVVSAITHLISRQTPTLFEIFNCADGHPVRAGAITAALTSAVPVIGISATPRRTRSNQRVRIDRLQATGWTPSVSSIFHGLALLGHHVQPSAAQEPTT